MNGNSRLIAAPRSSPQNVGGVYRIIGGELEDDRGEGEMSSLPEYCSESEGMGRHKGKKILFYGYTPLGPMATIAVYFSWGNLCPEMPFAI